MDRRSFIKNSLAAAVTIGCGATLGALAGPSSAQGHPVRPPGARSEDEFLSKCIRCMRCVDACPNQAIIPLDSTSGPRLQSTPAIKARRQACMLCNKIDGDYLKCTEACPTGALQLVRKDPDDIQAKVSMGVAEIDTSLCYSYNGVSCGACYWACPFPGKSITLGMWEKPTIHADACIGCGLCERACIRYPQAIRVRPAPRPERVKGS